MFFNFINNSIFIKSYNTVPNSDAGQFKSCKMSPTDYDPSVRFKEVFPGPISSMRSGKVSKEALRPADNIGGYYVDPDPSDISFGNPTFTMAFWIKPIEE